MCICGLRPVFFFFSADLLLCAAARGLHLPAVDLIVQYDAPEQIEDYVHRVGRTARMGAEGTVLSNIFFCIGVRPLENNSVLLLLLL